MGLVEWALQHGRSSYHLANAKDISASIKELAMHASIVSFITDAVLGLLLTEDRLCAMYEAVQTEIQSEVEYALRIT